MLETEVRSSSRRSWRLQFSLRMFLLLSLVAGSWIGLVARSASQQAEAVRQLRARGAEVYFQDEVSLEGEFLATPKPYNPGWLEKLFGADAFGTVTGVVVEQVEKLDSVSALQLIEHLTDLRLILVQARSEWKLDGSLVKVIAQLSELRGLYLHNAQIRVDDLQGFGQLSSLRQLGLNRVTVTGGIPRWDWVAALGDLQGFNVEGKLVNDDVLRALKGAKSLSELCLAGTAITDAGLQDFCQGQKLSLLDLSNTKVTNLGIAYLTELGSCNELVLNENRSITDLAIGPFVDIKGLKSLDLFGTRVTEFGGAQLEALLPNVRVSR